MTTDQDDDYTDAHLAAGLLPSDLLTTPRRLPSDYAPSLPSDRRPSWRDSVLPSDLRERVVLPSDEPQHRPR